MKRQNTAERCVNVKCSTEIQRGESERLQEIANQCVWWCQCFYQYLLGKALCVLQAVREGLEEEVAAVLAHCAVAFTFLAGLGKQSQPHLGHGVTAGLLPEQGGKVQDLPQIKAPTEVCYVVRQGLILTF